MASRLVLVRFVNLLKLCLLELPQGSLACSIFLFIHNIIVCLSQNFISIKGAIELILLVYFSVLEKTASCATETLRNGK